MLGIMAIATNGFGAEDEGATATKGDVVYVGTYTGKGSEGIYRFRLDREAGALKPEGLAAKIANPSFLAVSPNRKFLVCCNEISDFHGKRQGAGTSFAVDAATGELRQVSQSPSGGAGTCYVSVTPDGRAVLLANYGSGSAAAVAFDSETGEMTPPPAVGQHSGRSVVPKRQEAPHAHCFLAPGEKSQAAGWAFAVDLGIDEIRAYRLDGQGGMDTSSPVITKTDPGAGPRHIAFHPGGEWAYVSNELSNTITAWRLGAEGKMTPVETVGTLPGDFTGAVNTTAEVLVRPDGKYVYLSNRGHNSVAVFKVNDDTGGLSVVGHVPTRGDHPRGMALSPDGKFLLVANQNSDSLVVYRVEEESGMPVFASEFTGINRPTGFVFL